MVMKIVERVDELKSLIQKSNLVPVGMVPTMGALHEGHISLVKNAINRAPLVVISIYVNPTQFNDKNDFNRYPRTTEKDIELLEGVLRPNDILFLPSDDEMYPEPDTRKFDFGNLEKVMEGPLRPGHFNGVGQIVSKLFMHVDPDIAFFGLKDFQQVAVIKNLVRQMGADIEIIPCPIVRENDGLAMSSRNSLLEPSIRNEAPVIYKSLSMASRMFGEREITEIKKIVSDIVESKGILEVEYFEIVDEIELVPLKKNEDIDRLKNYYGCIAVRAGKIRLIDNVAMEPRKF
jgi:pantoate--beta-alanine ligase